MPSGSLSDFPATFDGELPPFAADGDLPPGDFQPSKPEFEARFVNTGDHSRRITLYDGWNNHRLALIAAAIPASSRQLINGSYTTAKRSPGDIDLAVEVPVADGPTLAAMPPEHPAISLLQGPLTKPGYYCDAYPIYALPKSEPDYAAITVRAIDYWTKWFGRNRGGAPKGRVWATTGGLQ
jgi:hypothetical protein